MHKFNIRFIDRKWLWFSISGAIIAVGLLSMALGGLKFGIEFKGGNQYDVVFQNRPAVSEIRKVLDPIKLGASTIQNVGSNNVVQIRTPRLTKAQQTDMKNALTKNFKLKEGISLRDIGPGWGQEVTNGALRALVVSLFVLLLYISIRFEFKMAVAAILALVHDGLIVVGIYSFVGLLETKLGISWIPSEITPNTVAALLTILGFSLYDTIVVFHRIKENTELIGKRTYSMMTNDSINQVLMRSINTSLTALIPVFVLLLFGGETLKDFAFAMFVGLISGAYSSIFIASPILAMWKETEQRYRMIREKLTATGQIAAKTAAKASATASDVSSRGAEATRDLDAQLAEQVPVVTPKMKTAAQKAKKKGKKKRKK
jgi:preprotein translocase SecF subunit